jgi:hypothetical protein
MPTRSPTTPRLLPLALLASLLAALLVLAWGASPAGATVKTFHAVHKAPRAISFKPRGIDPQRVRRASVRLRRHGRIVQRRVGLARVRRALRSRHQIRLSKARRARRGKLVIVAAPPRPRPTPPSSCTGSFSAAAPPPACWRPYSPASPFNTPLGASPAVSASSTQIVSNWLSTWSGSDKTSAPRFTAGYAETVNDYDHPVYFSSSSDPLYTVHCAEAWGKCPVEGAQVQIPATAKPAGGDDGHLAVFDQASGWEYDFWQVRQQPAGGGTLTVSWGGKTRVDGSGLGSAATAGNFGLAAGIIRPQELAAGRIDHALFMVVKCTNGTSVAPAGPDTGRSCASIGLPNAGAPAMGQHFFLDMSAAEIEALGVPAWQKTVLRAMAEYGLYVGDTGGGFLKLESGSSYTSLGQADPWVGVGKGAGIAASREGTYSFDLAAAVDWRSRLKVAG